MNWCTSLDFFPSKTGFTVFRAQPRYKLHCSSKGESPTYILNEDTHPVIRAIGLSHTACRDMSFDKMFDLTAGVQFYFYNNTKIQ